VPNRFDSLGVEVPPLNLGLELEEQLELLATLL
jgi:hypothetical protein